MASTAAGVFLAAWREKANGRRLRERDAPISMRVSACQFCAAGQRPGL